MFALNRIAPALFVLALALLPAAEWRSLVLPINGKSLAFDPLGQGSASPFDVVFLFFCIAIVPIGVRFLRERHAISPFLAHWVIGFVLIAVMLAANVHSLPFLTPEERKVVDARSLILHFVVMMAVAIYVSTLRLEALVRGMFAFCAASAVGLALLSTIALLELPYLRLIYPFGNPSQIAFPFPNYNVAAPFITVASIGLVGAALSMHRPAAIAVGLPVFVVAAALTGSRSNLFIMVGSFAAFATVLALINLERRGSSFSLRRIGGSVTVAAVIVMTAIVAVNDWQPVRRAVSIFGDVLNDPMVLVRGKLGSPRNEMWGLARPQNALPAPDDDRDYEIVLTSVIDGCVSESKPIRGLKAGRQYRIRMTQRLDTLPPTAILEVFSEPTRKNPLGRSVLQPSPGFLPHIYLYLADSGRNYVVQQGSLSEFRFGSGPGPRAREALAPTGGLRHFDPRSGEPRIPVEVGEDKVRIAAKNNRVRGFINMDSRVHSGATRTILEYKLELHRVTYTLPLDAPAMFYVGMHDTEVSGEDENWTRVRNAILVQHRRQTEKWEEYSHATQDVERVWIQTRDLGPGERRLEYGRFVRDRQCEKSKGQAVSGIWKALFAYDENDLSFENIYGARVAPGKGVQRDQISIKAGKGWSPVRHLEDGGSTHNLYLDWYYYGSVSQLIAFVLFMFTLVASTAIRAWKSRRSAYAPLLCAVAFQVLAIAAIMYAQPYIWIKFYWVVFGLASGLGIHAALVQKSGDSSDVVHAQASDARR